MDADTAGAIARLRRDVDMPATPSLNALGKDPRHD